MPPRRRRPITAEDLLRIAVVDDPRLSPDGHTVAFVVMTVDRGANEYRSATWSVPAAGGVPVPFTSGERRDTAPRWSPAGDRLAFLSDRAGGTPQVYVMPARGGEARPLTSLADAVRDVAWSPAGEHLAFVARVRPGGAPGPDDETPPMAREIDRIKHKLDGQGLLIGREHIFVVAADGGDARQITHGDWDDHQPAWSPDGAHITCAGRAADGPLGANIRLWLLPAEGGPAALGPRT